MTNKEAIQFLSQIMDALLASNSWLPSTDNPIKESFGMAINALTAQAETHEKRTETHGVCLDTISRQAAIDAITRKMVSIPTAGEKDLISVFRAEQGWRVNDELG